MKYVCMLFLGCLLGSATAACETGKEVVGLKSAIPARESDGRVRIDVVLACTLVEGQPRVTNTCDADGEDFCIEARFVTADDRVVGTGTACDSFKHVEGTGMSLRSAQPIAGEAKRVRVWSSMLGEGSAMVIELP